MKIILALALLLPIAAAAEPVTALTASIASYHFNRTTEHCEVNPGVGFEHGSTSSRAVAGLYHNSDCRLSGYLGYSMTTALGRGWHAGGATLVLTGYQKDKKGENGERRIEDKALLVPTLILAYEGRQRGVNIGYIPPERLLRILSKKDGKQEDEFKGLLFIQVKVLKW